MPLVSWSCSPSSRAHLALPGAQPCRFHQHPRPHEVGNCEVNDATNDASCRDWIRPRTPTTRAYCAQIEEVATTHRRFARFPRQSTAIEFRDSTGSRTNVRESEEGEGLRCASKILFLTSRSRVATERNQTGLLGMQFERELAHSFAKFREKLHRIGVVLEPPQPDASRCAQGAPPVGQLPGAGPAMRSSTIARFVRKRRRTPSSAAAGSRSSIARSMSATMGKRTLRDERS
jgi:hypothetical protein